MPLFKRDAVFEKCQRKCKAEYGLEHCLPNKSKKASLSDSEGNGIESDEDNRTAGFIQECLSGLAKCIGRERSGKKAATGCYVELES